MRKSFLLLGLCLGTIGAAQAQSIKYGVKAGASLTNVTGSDSGDLANKFGFNGGVLANFGLNDMFSIQPEVLYSMKGFKDKNDDSNHANLDYIDIPVLVKVATGATGLFFEAGPQVGFLTSAKVTAGPLSVDFKDYFNSVDFGYAAGIGFQAASGPMVGLRYNGGLTNIGKNGTINGFQVSSGNAKNSAFQLYVGFLFGGK